jgi:dienelactone hydrolase
MSDHSSGNITLTSTVLATASSYWHRPLYRPEQAMDGWSKVFAFFGKHLAK